MVMPIRKTQLINGEMYHLVKRGLDKIFLDNEDYLRFINSLLVFNDRNSVPWESRAFWNQRDPVSLGESYKPKEPLVEVHVFTLMPNHFHLLLRQLIEGGISTFMQKLGGYSYYFNKKYERKGPLFQSPYKIKIIETEPQLKNNFVYIHTNPVEIIEPGWKEWRVKDPRAAIQFLEEKYRWSSYWDYIGERNFPSVMSRSFFLEFFNKEQGIKQEINSWIQFKNEIFKDEERLKKIHFE